MNKAQLKQKILDTLNGMSEDECIGIYNDGCQYFNYTNDMAFPMDQFDALESNRPFSEIYRNIDTDDFSFYDDYYYFDCYRHYHSFSYIEDSELTDNLEQFIDSAIDDEYNFGNSKIAEVYEEAENEE